MNPAKIDDRDDGLIIWRFTEKDGSTVDVEATDAAAATAKYDEWKTQAAPAAPAPTAVQIANVLVDAVTTAADFDAAKANLAAAQAGLPPEPAAATKKSTGKTARGK